MGYGGRRGLKAQRSEDEQEIISIARELLEEARRESFLNHGEPIAPERAGQMAEDLALLAIICSCRCKSPEARGRLAIDLTETMGSFVAHEMVLASRLGRPLVRSISDREALD